MSSGTQFTVLVVDDERDVTELYKIWLAEHFDVRVAYNGEEALKKLDSSVDVVLLDRRMPGLSGDEVLDTISERDIDCRVVMVTAVKPSFDVIEMGFDDYLVKPVDSEELHEIVTRMLQRTEYDAKLREYFALASKRALLETQKRENVLDTNESYVELVEELTELQDEVEETRAEFTSHGDFVDAFRDIS